MPAKSLKSYWREITSIIEGGLKPDPHRVSSFADHLAQRLEDDGEARLANRIRRLTAEASGPAGSIFVAQGLPSDVESQQALVERILPSEAPNYPHLPSFQDSELRRFVELNRMSGVLVGAGIDPPSSLLLYGPPGCGKTMTAVAISSDLQLPLYLVRLDSLLGSYLGNSAKNLRRVFDVALASPCILLLDEFDAVGKMRDDAQEVGEVKRLIGSLLQNLDRIRGGQVIIAATNHHHMLDPAIWRRFDVTLHLERPTKVEAASIIRSQIAEERLSSSEVEALATLFAGFSGSDITSVINRALQDEFLYPEEPLGKLITFGLLARQDMERSSAVYADNKRELILATYHQARGELTSRQVARLVDCSHTYAHAVIGTLT